MRNNNMEIDFHFLHPVTLPNRKALKIFIEQIFRIEKTPGEFINFIFCDDEYLLSINKMFLGHHFFTDIISFNLNLESFPVQGEIYISVPRVKENAKILKQTLTNELHRVIFHGVLHFCQYDDKSEVDKKTMRNRENFYLNKYFVPRGTS